MKLWSRSHSLQQKIITAIVMVGLLPLSLSLFLSYLEERRALRETIVEGVKTSIPFQLRVLDDPAFLAGTFTSVDSRRLTG